MFPDSYLWSHKISSQWNTFKHSSSATVAPGMPGKLLKISSPRQRMAGRKASKKSSAAFSLKQRGNKNNSYYFFREAVIRMQLTAGGGQAFPLEK
jgi:hypothetical protein